MGALDFLKELRRRRVFRAAGAYAVVGVAVLEAVDVVLPRLGTPDWVVTVFVVAVLAGFPVVLVMAWALEITSDGIAITPPASGRQARVESRTPWGGYAAVFLFGAAVSAAGWTFLRPDQIAGTGVPGVRSLAVLPFAPLSDDPDDHWLAQGLHYQLNTELSRLGGLDRVIDVASVLRYADERPAVSEITDALGVDAVIEGAILPATDRVRIHVQLIAGATQDHLWAQDYDRDREGALEMVKSVAQDIARELEVELSASDQVRLAERQVVSPAAQEAYFRGRSLWNQRDSAGTAGAIREFRRAIELDPDYGAPYAGLASIAAIRRPELVGSSVEELATRALDRDPHLAEAYTALAYHRLLEDYAWEESEELFRRATEVQPGYSTAWQWGSELLVGLGRSEEGVAWIRRARELDPFSPIIAWNELRTLYLAGEFQECLVAHDLYQKEFPGFRPSHGWMCQHMLGDFSGVMEAGQVPDSVRALVGSGNEVALWEWILGEYGAWWPGYPGLLWRVGREEEAFEFFDAMFDSWGGPGLNLAYVLADPFLEPLRQDPRWHDRVLRRVKLNTWPAPAPPGTPLLP